MSLAPVVIGTSGWAYPSWKPGFYPAGTASSDFLRFYSERFSTVELNTTGYRLPAEEQFERWAEQTPPGFTFAPKLPARRPRVIAEFSDRVRRLGDRLGPVRVSFKSARDEGLLELLLGSLDPSLRLAFDLEGPSWDGIELQALVAEDRSAAHAVEVGRAHPGPHSPERRHLLGLTRASVGKKRNGIRAAASSGRTVRTTSTPGRRRTRNASAMARAGSSS